MVFVLCARSVRPVRTRVNRVMPVCRGRKPARFSYTPFRRPLTVTGALPLLAPVGARPGGVDTAKQPGGRAGDNRGEGKDAPGPGWTGRVRLPLRRCRTDRARRGAWPRRRNSLAIRMHILTLPCRKANPYPHRPWSRTAMAKLLGPATVRAWPACRWRQPGQAVPCRSVARCFYAKRTNHGTEHAMAKRIGGADRRAQ